MDFLLTVLRISYQHLASSEPDVQAYADDTDVLCWIYTLWSILLPKLNLSGSPSQIYNNFHSEINLSDHQQISNDLFKSHNQEML